MPLHDLAPRWPNRDATWRFRTIRARWLPGRSVLLGDTKQRSARIQTPLWRRLGERTHAPADQREHPPARGRPHRAGLARAGKSPGPGGGAHPLVAAPLHPTTGGRHRALLPARHRRREGAAQRWLHPDRADPPPHAEIAARRFAGQPSRNQPDHRIPARPAGHRRGLARAALQREHRTAPTAWPPFSITSHRNAACHSAMRTLAARSRPRELHTAAWRGAAASGRRDR